MANKTLNTRIVLRNDSTINWNGNSVETLKKGEMGLEFLENGKVKIKVGDGEKSWKELPYAGGDEAQVFQCEAQEGESNDMDIINRVVGETEIHTGDTAIVKKTFGTDKISYTAYVYDGEWKAMDGNYNAENVYFDKDLQTTVAIGNIGLTNGQATISAAGKNLNEVWDKIFVKAKDPNVTNPSASLSGTDRQYLEIGTSGTASVTISLDDGKYEYGYDNEGTTVNDGTTGVKASKNGYHIVYNGSTQDTQTAKIDSGVKTSKDTMSATGSIDYDGGFIPVNNVGTTVPSKAISSGTAHASSKELFRWYVPMYTGFKYEKDAISNPASITAEEVKGLTKIKDGTAYNQTVPSSAKAINPWMQWFVAVPSSYNRKISGAKDSNNLTLTVVKANDVTISYNGTDVVYNVWFINNAAPYDTKDITINW